MISPPLLYGNNLWPKREEVIKDNGVFLILVYSVRKVTAWLVISIQNGMNYLGVNNTEVQSWKQ